LGCALAIKKVALEKYNLKNFEIAHDYFISQKLSAKNKLGFIPDTLSFYRQHEDQVCGLREALQQETKTQETPSQTAFQKEVWPILSAIKKYKELYPEENHRETQLYHLFIVNRNQYLKSLSFVARKKYILQCIRHKYLDLHFSDLFKY
jgi:hypothetical protein